MRRGLALVLLVAGCTDAPASGAYLGVDTRLLEEDLVQFSVAMRPEVGAVDIRDKLSAYAQCAAAQYALIRDYGFARQIRTTFTAEGGIRRADAVYTVSSGLPDGIRALDAEVIVDDCRARGIPTV